MSILTQEQIAAARQSYDDAIAEAAKPAYEHAEAIQESADHARVILAALEAYGRVVELLGWLSERVPVEAAPRELCCWNAAEVCARLRAALEGTP